MIRDDGQTPDETRSSDPGAESLDELDDRFLAQLIDFDEAMADGTIPLPLDDTGLSGEQAKRLKAIRDCLIVLAGMRQLHGADGGQSAAREDAPEGKPVFAQPNVTKGDLTSRGDKRSGGRFGRFELLHRLGSGGSGVVYLARDPQLNREVALKVPLPYWFDSDDFRQRFLREGEAAAMLSHPHIITVYEVSEYGPVCYIASEYCSGPSLAAFLDSRTTPIAPRAAAAFVANLADAMQHAHARGVLHRDLKPSNVFLVPGGVDVEAEAKDGDEILEFTPKIGDFGLAKLQKQVGNTTRSGAVLGSLHYMSPEQASGSISEMTLQTDIYGLGTILYALLTGEPPFRGDTDFETLQMIVSADATPPRRLRADVPADLSAVCLKCLEKDPAARYESAAALAEDLRRFLADRPTIARGLSPLGQAYRWIRRYPAYAAMFAICFLALLTVIGSTTAYNARLRVAVKDAQTKSLKNRELLYSSEIRLAQDAWRATNFEECTRILSRQIPGEGEPDLREFAWHYLWKQCHVELQTLRGHTGDVYNVAFSADGKLLFSGGKDGSVCAWDVPSGELVRTFTGHEGEVNTVVATSDGQLASASDDHTIRVWDVPSGRERLCLKAHDGRVFGLAASRRGKWLVAGDAAGRICLWDYRSGEQLWSRDGDTIVESLSFSPDDRGIVSAHFDGTIHLWDRETGRQICETNTEAGSPVTAAYSPNFSRIAVGGRTGFLATYRHASEGWERIASQKLDHKAIGVHGLAFSPRDNTLAIGRRDGLIELLNAGQEIRASRILPGHYSRVWSVAWSLDGRLLASASADGTVKIWSATRPRYWCDIYPRLDSAICSIAVSPDQRSILTGSMDGHVREWNRTTRQVGRFYSQAQDEMAVATYLEDGTAVAIRPTTGVQRWELATGEVTLLAALPDEACSQVISHDRKLIAVGCERSTAVLIDAQTGDVRHRLKTASLAVNHLALSPDGQLLATAGVGEPIELWDTQTGQRKLTLFGHANRTLCLAFAPDSNMLASGGSDQYIRLWDVNTGELIATLVGESTVTALAISPDGRNLASGSARPAAVQLWDLVTRQPLARSGQTLNAVSALVFTRDGQTVVAGSEAGLLVEWTLDDRRGSLERSSLSSRIPLRPEMLGVTTHESAADGPGHIEIVQAVQEYARRSGFVTGYPTFHRTPDGEDFRMQVVLLSSNASTIRVSLDEFCDTVALSRAANQRQSSLLVRMLRVSDIWFRDKGYKGALPSLFVAMMPDGAPQFEITLLASKHFRRRRVSSRDLGEDVESAFRQAHSWAVESGFASAFPTFTRQQDQTVVLAVDADQAEIREVRMDDLLGPDRNR